MKDSENTVIPEKKWYIVCNDTFMSSWGMAKGKINKLVFGCDTPDEAENVCNNATKRDDMSYVACHIKLPYYSKNKYYLQYKDKESYPAWFEPNSF